MRNVLRLCPWNALDDLPVDDAVDMFYDFVHAAISDHIPVVHLSRKFPPWFDRTVRKALKDKERAFAAKNDYLTIQIPGISARKGKHSKILQLGNIVPT